MSLSTMLNVIAYTTPPWALVVCGMVVGHVLTVLALRRWVARAAVAGRA